MGLYQRVRPKTFDEVVGNQAAISSLRKTVAAAPDGPHTFLFIGPSGCGKTTMGRILASEVGCDQFNIQEANGSNNRGIDDARELIKQANYAGMGGGNRCVIIDEVHGLTKDAQTCLLKALEDVPPYQYWILCTTDPQKILPTIKTRCDQIKVQPLNDDEMETLIERACEKGELPDPEDDVFFAIMDAAEGCPRKALVLLEKVNGMDSAEALKVIEGFTEESPESIELCRAIAGGDWGKASKLFIELTKGRPPSDAEGIRHMIAGYLKACLIKSNGSRADSFADALGFVNESVMYSFMPGLLFAVYNATKTIGSTGNRR